jgi:hypothetical protein
MQSLTVGTGYSEQDAKVAAHGDKGQGDYLTGAKRDRKK